MTLRSSLVNHLWTMVPQNARINRFCQHYVDRYRGENNSDMRMNGELSAMQKILPFCNEVFDVGANIGNWAAFALNINPGLAVHCFEASRITYEHLLRSPVGSRVQANHLALGAEEGEATLHVFEPGGGMNSLYRRRGLSTGVPSGDERVPMTTLERYCSAKGIEQIDFVKLDVEGHEMAVLAGAETMLAKGRIAHIQFEYGGSNIDSRVLLRDFFDLFMGHNYRLSKIYPNRLQPIDRYTQDLENFQYQNWMATYG